ncbi:MAG: SLC13 family permease [Cyclobacteriaceae bacterium]
MDLTFSQGYVLSVVVFLVLALYREWFNPALTFFIAVVALLLGKVITPGEILQGLSNPQIIIIFLLMLATAGIRSIFGSEVFSRVFNPSLSPKAFLFRMMVTVSSMSSVLNNTPIVAFMIPYVKDWARKTGNPASKFLIPLSYATILGGMITVIGTSTNLVLNGLVMQYDLPLLGFRDFFYLGVIVTIAGGLYLYLVGYRLLPTNPNEIDALRENLKEYIIETEIAHGSTLRGKTVKEAGLRNLQDVFLVEIIRDDKVISPVSPDEALEEKDALFFSGNTQSIYQLIREDNGLSVPEGHQTEPDEHFNFVEAVIPANSELIGVRIRDSDFRKRFHASIIAIHRNGKRVPGKVGEMHLAGGDFLLLLAGDHRENGNHEKDLFFLSVPKKVKTAKDKNLKFAGIASVLLLVSGVVGVFPLFDVCLVILSGLVFLGVLGLVEIRRELDLSLLLILVCSLALGVGLEKSGAADIIAYLLVSVSEKYGPVAVLASLFLVTTFLTALISNAAAVSIVFPIAMGVAEQLDLSYTPFFVAIAFAASGDFMTPIGYQTNLMVYGPGGYTFRDFLRVGSPLTLMYTILCIVFISYFYNLV